MASTTSVAPLVGRARTEAAAAASSAGVEVRSLAGPEEARAAAALFDAVWQRPLPVVPPDFLQAIEHSGGYLAGARRPSGGGLVGASVGLLGQVDGLFHLHSHATGVERSAHRRGIGRAIKLHQRAWCLERGIPTIRWTFDPLLRANVTFNLGTLGAVLTAYHVRFYGDLHDAYNAGDETDRALATWDLAGPPPGWPSGPPTLVLAKDGSGAPEVVGDLAEAMGGPVLAQLPEDIVGWRSTDPGLALAWRRALRAVLVPAMGAGYVGTRVSPTGQLLLERHRP